MKKMLGGKSGTLRLLVLLAVMIPFVFAMTGCGDTEEPAEEAETTAAETTQAETAAPEEWYTSIIEDEAVTKDYPYYRVLDLDQDGVDELFLSSTEKAFIGAEDKAKLMGNVDGEPVDVKEIGGAGGESFSYDAGDKALFYFSRISGEKHLVKYNYENGELIEVQTADEYDEYHDPESATNIDDTYYLDGKKVTEAKAELIWDQFDDIAVPVTYSKDGQGQPYADDDADEPDDGDDDDEYDD